MKKIDCRGKRVLVISDTHAPYHYRELLTLMSKARDEIKPDLVIHIGDEADKHALSFHNSDPNLDSAGKELELARKTLGELNEIFPEMLLLESNHGSLIYRRSKANGIPREYLKPLDEVYGVTGWSWHEEILIRTKKGKVYFCHGKTGRSSQLSKEMGCSTVQGHFHSKLEILWRKTALQDVFDMYVGCLINRQSMAFHYAKNNIPMANLGFGWIDEFGMPHLWKV